MFSTSMLVRLVMEKRPLNDSSNNKKVSIKLNTQIYNTKLLYAPVCLCVRERLSWHRVWIKGKKEKEIPAFQKLLI